MGYGCSKFLVKEVAKAGRGSYSFVDEKSENLKGKVINALRKAVEPSLKECKFVYSAAVILDSPQAGLIGEAFRNELVSQFMILSRIQFEQLSLKFVCREDPVTKTPIDLEFSAADFRMLEPGDQLFKLAAKRRTKDIYSTIETIKDIPAIKSVDELKKDIEGLSVQY